MAYNFIRTSTQNLSSSATSFQSFPLTIAAWFKTTTTSVQMGIARAGSRVAQTPSQALLLTTTSQIAASTRTPITNLNSTAGTSLNNGQWNHGAAVFSAANSRTAWANGVNGTTNTTSQSLATLESIWIGTRIATTDNFNGDIAEVGFWNTDLNASEIASLAKGMTCDKVRPQNLVFYAPIVRSLIDIKGNLTITNNGGASVVNHPRIYA